MPQKDEDEDETEDTEGVVEKFNKQTTTTDYRMQHVRDNLDKLMEFFTSTLGLSSASAKAVSV